MSIIDQIAQRQRAEMTGRAERAEAFIRALPCTCPDLPPEAVGLCDRCDFVFQLDRKDGR